MGRSTVPVISQIDIEQGRREWVRKLVEYVFGESILYREYVTDIHTVLEKNPVQCSPRDREGLPKVGYNVLSRGDAPTSEIPSFKNCNESVLYGTVVGFHFRRSQKSAFLSHLPR
jgi:hypothetical protein